MPDSTCKTEKSRSLLFKATRFEVVWYAAVEKWIRQLLQEYFRQIPLPLVLIFKSGIQKTGWLCSSFLWSLHRRFAFQQQRTGIWIGCDEGILGWGNRNNLKIPTRYWIISWYFLYYPNLGNTWKAKSSIILQYLFATWLALSKHLLNHWVSFLRLSPELPLLSLLVWPILKRLLIDAIISSCH